MKQLSKSSIADINKEILEQFGVSNFFEKKERIVLDDFEHKIVILKDKKIMFFYDEGKIVPSLKLLMEKNFLKQATVDMGAVKFVASGADIMRPGIVDIDTTIKKDEIVAVVDQTHKKPLCTAKALFTGEEIKQMKEGKVLKNIHYIGDKLWKV